MSSPDAQRLAPTALMVLHSDTVLAIGAYGPVHLCIYRSGLTAEALELANGHHRALMQRHTRTFVLGSALPNLPLPPAEVRHRGAQLIKENGAHVEAAAMVLEGSGFWASAVRSVITASFAMAQQPYPSKAFARELDAAVWLTSFAAGAALNPASIANAVAQLRQA